jgi:methylmalonyl-CoA/ethylmalonyl-CoA epimerase
MKLEHIGIACKDGERSKKIYGDVLDLKPYMEESIPSEKVKAVVFKVGDMKIELLFPESEDSAIAKFLKDKGRDHIHHMAFIVEDMQYQIERLKEKGYEFVKGYPRQGKEGMKVAFLHPKTTGGVLIELVGK